MPPPPPTALPVARRGIFGTGIPSTVAFALALLLFLMPFAQIKCGGTAVFQKSGVDFALGNDWKPTKNLGNDMFKDNDKKPDKKEGNAPIFIIVAMGCAVLGILVSLIRSRSGASLTALVGVAGVASLVAFMIMVKNWFNNAMAKDAADKTKSSEFGDVKFTLDFTTFLYIAVVAFLAAAIFAFMRLQKKNTA